MPTPNRHSLIPLLGSVILIVLVLPQFVGANLAGSEQTGSGLAHSVSSITTATPLADNPYWDPATVSAGQVATRSTDVLFIQNVGQFDPDVLYQVRGTNGIIWFAKNAIWITIVELENQNRAESLPRYEDIVQSTIRIVNIELQFKPENHDPLVEAFERLDTMVNYTLPAEPETWHAGLFAWSGIVYRDLVNGVDLQVEAAPLDRSGGTQQGTPLQWRFNADFPPDSSVMTLGVTGANDFSLTDRHLVLNLGTQQFSVPLPSAAFPFSLEATSQNGVVQTHEILPVSENSTSDQLRRKGAKDLFSYVLSDEPGEAGRFLGSLPYPTHPGTVDIVPEYAEQGQGLPPGAMMNLSPEREQADEHATPDREPQAFTRGDLFVAIGSGRVQWRRSDGSLIQTMTTAGSGYTTGMMVNRNNNRLYVTNFSSDRVSVFSPDSALLGTFGSGYYSHPESILFDASGNALVGQADGYRDILKFNSSGSLIAQYNVGTHYRGSDWIELAADQCTIYYTSESYVVKRFNICTNSQMTDFTAGLHGYAYALRLIPGGGMLVADTSDIHRLNSNGAIVKTYDASGENNWFALNIAPNGTSFWSADLSTSDVFRFDIASGSQILAFDAGYGTSVGGLAVVGEVTVAYIPNVIAPIDNPPRNGTVRGNITISGYAIDRNSASGTGIDQVHIYLDGPYGTGRIIGAAQYGLSRPDVGNYYGNQRFTPSGWQLSWNIANVSAGAHSLYLYAHRTTDNRWSLFGPHPIVVAGPPTPTLTVTPTPTYAPNVIAQIETPVDGGAVAGSVTISGYAIDRNSQSGTGVSTVHIYLDGPFGSGTFLGQAEYGLNRPDIGSRYGNARFTPSGWRLTWNVGNLSNGTHRLYLYARRTTDNQWAMRGPHNVVVLPPTPVPPCQRYEPNNTLSTATGPLANNQTMEAALCTGDPDDIFFIELSAGATLTLDLTNLPTGTDFDLFLYNSAGGNAIAESRNNGVEPERIVKSITAGRYYIRVYPYSGRSEQAYRLRVVWGNTSANEESGITPVDKPPPPAPITME